MKFDMHIHTIYSDHWYWGRDALNTPEEMIKAAKKRGLDGIAITDHDSIKGALNGLKIAKKMKFIVIPGAEIRSRSGDILGLGIKENVKPGMSIEETIEKIHDLGGISVAAHPFFSMEKRKGIGKEAVRADAVEVFNSTSATFFMNRKARMLAEKYKRPFSAGSDAHYYKDVGNAGIICNDPLEDILKRKVKIFGAGPLFLI